ncbi:MAG: hypothetical protein IAE95_05405 [Chitinophagaceae bacterium]|nr:hypothetical protein [Chitinophagaceae bacterium]
MLIANFPDAIPSINTINYDADILLTIDVFGIKIGIESTGDPKSRMLDTVARLGREEKCNIIICATRTEGATVNKVDEVADVYDYHTLWISTYWSSTLDYKFLNHSLAKNIVELVTALVHSRLKARNSLPVTSNLN